MLVATMLCTVLAGCGGGSGSGSSSTDYSDSKFLGTWKATSMAIPSDSTETDFEWMITLNADGTAQFVDEDGTTDINWEPTSDGFKTKGDTKLTFTEDGDNIKTKLLGVDIIFEKQ